MRVGTQVRSAFDRSIAVNRVGDLLFNLQGQVLYSNIACPHEAAHRRIVQAEMIADSLQRITTARVSNANRFIAISRVALVGCQ